MRLPKPNLLKWALPGGVPSGPEEISQVCFPTHTLLCRVRETSSCLVGKSYFKIRGLVAQGQKFSLNDLTFSGSNQQANLFLSPEKAAHVSWQLLRGCWLSWGLDVRMRGSRILFQLRSAGDTPFSLLARSFLPISQPVQTLRPSQPLFLRARWG